jgi:hypothetical protein
LSRYNWVIEELRNKSGKLASEYIPELYHILRVEDQLSPEDSRTKIENDCGDIWTKDTIRKYLPAETKSLAKRKAGKMSADAKKIKKKRIEPQLLVATTTDSNQYSAVLNQGGNCNNYEQDPVGMNPTENSPIASQKQKSSMPNEVENIWDENSLHHSLITNRYNNETWEEEENLLLAEDKVATSSSLLFPSNLAEQIYKYVRALESEKIPDFKLEHNGVRIISISRWSDIKT